MSQTSCGCNTQPCGCCEGVEQLTPAAVCNRPGLPALSYRVGTQAKFLETMKARLATLTVEGVGADGQTVQSFRPLQGLSTRDASDFSIALLDGWATVGDVLSFYQERIANEGYLRTATERRSVLELSRLVGYTPRPGVAASVFLAYTVDDNQSDPVTIPTGARSQSIPGPDETPQSFETSENLDARREWNKLQVRLHRPQLIDSSNAETIPSIHVKGGIAPLKPGDKLLLLFDDSGDDFKVRTVAGVNMQFADQHMELRLQPTSLQQAQQMAAGTIGASANAGSAATGSGDGYGGEGDGYGGPDLLPVTDSTQFIKPLLVPPNPQARNSIQLRRSLSEAFLRPVDAPATTFPGNSELGIRTFAARSTVQAQSQAVSADAGRRYADAGTQLLVNFVPHLAKAYYDAWTGAQLNPAPSPLKAVYVLRTRAASFGASASRLPTYNGSVLNPQNQWTEWAYQDSAPKNAQGQPILDETGDNVFLDQANDALAIGSYVIAEGSSQEQVLRITGVHTAPRSAYGLSGPSTRLTFDRCWRTVATTTLITDLRTTQFYVQSEPLTLVEEPLDGPVGVDADGKPSAQIELGGLYKELSSGRWVILSGERADIDRVEGVQAAELLMISGLTHSFDPARPGDPLHTTLSLATAPAYSYKRDKLTVYGNVVKATHGETRTEPLGSGDGAQTLQSFTLKQPPLTFVAAPTAAGAESTLRVYVNDVEWHETDSLAWAGPKDRSFTTLTDDKANTTLVFGNGEHGARLPTGVQNVNSVYRNGIGKPGNVRAGQISLLQTRPLGVKAVVNPLRASGGADKETRDQARDNAPLSVMPLDRLVSVQDYADFARRFAGIGKALALRTSDGRREIVYLSIAGADDIPIDASSDLYQNLLAALRRLGDPDLPLRVDTRELKILVMSARLKLQPDYRYEPVAAAVRAQLLDAFGFERRALGQPVLLSELYAAIQAVPGVAYVDIDALGAIPEKTTAADGTRSLITQGEIADAVTSIVKPAPSLDANGNPILPRPDHLPANIDAWPGGADKGVLRPAELVTFTPAVADTLILNQIP
jgi:predicted phage baseplate assembly protein